MNFTIDRSNDVAIVRLDEARLMYPLLADFAGAVTGLLVVGLGLLAVSAYFLILGEGAEDVPPLVGLAFAVFALATIFGAGPIVRGFFPRSSDPDRLIALTRIALASQVFFGVGTLLMAAQYARRSFTIPSLAPLVYNLAIIAGGVLGWLVAEPSPEWFLWGGLVGAAAGNFGLQWWGARRHGFRLVRGVPWFHPAVKEYLVLAFP